jgi:hypothetical protein
MIMKRSLGFDFVYVYSRPLGGDLTFVEQRHAVVAAVGRHAQLARLPRCHIDLERHQTGIAHESRHAKRERDAGRR